MKHREDIQAMIQSIPPPEEGSWIFDEESIMHAYQKDDDHQSLSVKILSVFGGLMGSLAFLGFLFIAGLYNSRASLLFFGILFIAAAIWLHKKYNKIIMDTLSVAFFIIGFLQVGFGCLQLDLTVDFVCIVFIIVVLASLTFVQNYMLSFVSVLIIHGSILTLVLAHEAYEFLHLYNATLAGGLMYLSFQEANIIASRKLLSKIYNPLKTGLLFSFLSVLTLLSKRGLFAVSSEYIWFSSIALIAMICYFIHRLLLYLELRNNKVRIVIYLLTFLALLPTVWSPAITGALLIILLSFMVHHRTGFALGILFFIYFIALYYYDLDITLLTKSILLCTTGLFFVALYLYTAQKMKINEEV